MNEDNIPRIVKRIAARKYRGWAFTRAMTHEEYKEKEKEILNDYRSMPLAEFKLKYKDYFY